MLNGCLAGNVMNRFDEFITAEDNGSRFLPTEDDVRSFAVALFEQNVRPDNGKKY